MRYLAGAVKFIGPESRQVAARGWREGGMASKCLMASESRFGKMNRVLEVEDGDDCTRT